MGFYDVKYKEKKCEICGSVYMPRSLSQKYCGQACAKIAERMKEAAREKTPKKTYTKKEKPKPNQELVDMAARAKQAGMSYGQYVALCHAKGI